MRVPEVAARMRNIAEDIRGQFPPIAEELAALADELKRRPRSIRSAITSVHITPKLLNEIRQYAEDNPHFSHQAIARKFNVNPGRVSEALRGKRK
jgi:hypothetical protein